MRPWRGWVRTSRGANGRQTSGERRIPGLVMHLINEGDLSFTEDELRRALMLAYPPAQAAALARAVAQDARAMHTRQDADAAIARGSRDPTEINAEFLVLPDFWFALLASLDADLEARVHAWQQRARLAARPARERNAMHDAGADPLAPPTAAVNEQLAAEDAAADAAWVALRAEVDAFLRRPLSERWQAVQSDAT